MSILRPLVWAIAPVTFAIGMNAATPDEVRETQTALNELGFDPGVVDGLWGRRTESALVAFLESIGESFDGTLSNNELDALRAAQTAFDPILTHAGHLFDPDRLMETQCFGRGSAFDPDTPLPDPIAAFNDSTSIGDSLEGQKERSWDFEQRVIAAATQAAMSDGAALDWARTALLTWAEAGAGLQTAQDRRYLGAGSGQSYQSAAPAPVLDMENAARLAYSSAVAHSLIQDQLSSVDTVVIRAWSRDLWYAYGGEFGARAGSGGNGIWSIFAAPATMAALDGEDESFAEHVRAGYGLINAAVNAEGAILQNAERGDRAMLYQSIGLLGIASLIDLVERQGGQVPTGIEDAMVRAVRFFLDAEEDLGVILPYASAAYNNPGSGRNQARYYREDKQHVWWMFWYIARYPDAEDSDRLRSFLNFWIPFDLRRLALDANWVPYPINCLEDVDLGELVLEGTQYADKLSVGTVQAQLRHSKDRFSEYGITLRDVAIGEESVEMDQFSVFVDFRGSTKQPKDVKSLRLVFYRASLLDQQSRQASYLDCHPVVAREQRGDQQLRLFLYGDSAHNACILDRFGPRDQVIWSSILAGFGSVLVEQSPEGPAADLLRYLQWASW